MNRSTELDFDQRISDWLEDDPNLAPRQAIETVLAAYPSISQRRPMGLPRRLTTMTMPTRLATAAVIGVLAVGGAYYLSQPAQPAVGPPAPTSSASPTPAPTSQAPATSAAETGSGSAHYEITGPDAASGDATFASGALDTSSDAFSQIARFQDGSLVIKIKFPPPGCDIPTCGTVDINTATGGMHADGCTWDTASLTADGATGTVECTNAVNPANPTTPNRVTITFTYQDPSGGQSGPRFAGQLTRTRVGSGRSTRSSGAGAGSPPSSS